jgi:hypothetical protein
MSEPPSQKRRSTWRVVLVFSVCVTLAAAAVAALAWWLLDADFSLTFVYLRWLVVFTLLAAPLVHRWLLAPRGVVLPTPFRTPATALLLACESIGYDIVSARLFH